jgi:hypothetical protein
MRRSPYGEFLWEISGNSSSYIDWPIIPEAFDAMPDSSSDRLHAVSTVNDNVVTSIEQGTTYSQAKRAPKFTQSSPWTRISTAIHVCWT